MAANVSQEAVLLKNILDTLTSIQKESKKNNKSSDSASVKAASSAVSVDAANIKQLGDSLKVLSSAIIPLTKLSDNDIDKVTKIITDLGQAIRSFSMDKETLATVNNMLSAFIQIHNVISGLADNFIKSFIKFSPLKGRILGRRLGKFYKNFLEGMSESLVTGLVKLFQKIPKETVKVAQQAANFKLMMATVLSIKKEDIMNLWFMGRMLGEKTGKNIGAFFKNLIDGMAGGPGGTAKANAAAKVAMSVNILIATLVVSLVALTLLAKNNSLVDIGLGLVMLTAIAVGAVYLMKFLGKQKVQREASNSIKSAAAILMLIGGLTFSLAILTAIAKKYDWKELGSGIALLSVVTIFALGIMAVLGTRFFKETAVKGIEGTGLVLLLIGGLTLSFMLVINIAKNNDWETLGKGILMLGALITFSLAILWVLGRPSFQQNAIKGLAGVGAVILLVAGLSLAMNLYTDYLKNVAALSLGDIIKGTLMMYSVVTGVIVIAGAIAAVMSTGIGAGILLAGVAGVELIAVMIASISGSMLLFTNLLEKVHNLNQKDINDAIDKIVGKGNILKGDSLDRNSLIGCLNIIIQNLSQFTGKQSRNVRKIGKALRPVIQSISQFVDVVQKMATMQIADQWDEHGKPIHFIKLDNEAFKSAASNLTDAFKTFLTDFTTGIGGLDKDSIKVIKKLFPGKGLFGREKAGIGTAINAISKFIDVVHKMATKSIPNVWDANGNPTGYIKLNDADFTKAATNITTCFGTFLETLNINLGKLSKKEVRAIKKISKALGGLLPELTEFMVPLMQIAAGKMQVGDQTVDINVANLVPTVTEIVNVIAELVKLDTYAKQDISHRKIKKLFKTFKKSLKHLSSAVQFITNSGLKVDEQLPTTIGYITSALGKITEFFTLDYEKIAHNAKFFKRAIRRFGKGLKWLFNNEFKISDIAEGFDNIVKNVIGEAAEKTSLYRLVDFLSMEKTFRIIKNNSKLFKKSMKHFVKGVKELVNDTFDVTKFGKTFNESSKQTVSGLSHITRFMGTTNFDPALKNSHSFEWAMFHTANGLRYIKPYLMTTPKEIIDLSNALKQLDAELLEKEDRRTKAIQSVSSNFKDMAQNIEMLNNSLSNSLRLSNEFNKMKDMQIPHILTTGANAIVDATFKVKDSVSSIINKDKEEEKQKEQEKQKQEQNNALASTIANAITVALSQWAEDHKDITIRIGEDGQPIFGSAYYG